MTKINLHNLEKEKLNPAFYQRNVLVVAKEILGKVFVKKEDNKILSGKIVEVEAYEGKTDQASHSFNGKTKRNEVMFEPGGLLYVYFTYGVHFCANIVTGKKDEGNAVLLRGIEPLTGIEIMAERRFGKTGLSDGEIVNLTNGPGKICQAFAIDREENGESLTNGKIYILNRPLISKSKIVETTRIGIKKSAELPWRFYIKDNKCVSRK